MGDLKGKFYVIKCFLSLLNEKVDFVKLCEKRKEKK